MKEKMKLKNKAVLVALLGILLYSIVLKYPTYSHQYLPDSPVFHTQVNMLSNFGKPIWNMHILSFWGLYPLSEPQGIIFILSSTHLLSSIHVEPSMIIMNVAALSVGILSSFCIGHKIFKNSLVGLLCGLFFIYAGGKNIFIATPRPIAAAFLPFIFLLLFFAYEKTEKKLKFLAILCTVLIFTFSIHRLTIFFLPVMFSFLIIAIFFSMFKTKISNVSFKLRRYPSKIDGASMIKLVIVPLSFLLVLIITLTSYQHFFSKADFLTQTALFSGDSLEIQIINFLYYMGKQMGPSSVFALLGFIFLIKKSNTKYEAGLYLGIIALIPLSMRHAYIHQVWLTPFALFAGYGLYRIGKFMLKRKHFKYVKITLLAIILISPVIITTAITIEEPFINRQPWFVNYMTDEEWETGIYLKSYLEEDEAGWSLRGRNEGLAAISNRNHMGMVGRDLFWANRSIGNELDIVYVGDLENASIADIIDEKGVFYQITNDPLFPERDNYYRDLHWIWLQNRYMSEDYFKIVDFYRLRIITLYKPFPDDLGRQYEIEFRNNLRIDAYKVYETSIYESYNVPMYVQISS